jgi:hypothetical protein
MMMNSARWLSGAALTLAGLGLLAGSPTADAASGRRAARHPAASSHGPAARKPAPAPDPSAGITRLEIAPASAVLDGPRAIQHLLVSATMKDGGTTDVTDQVTLTLGNPHLAKVASGVVMPLADGETHLVAKLGRVSSPSILITIRSTKAPSPVDFVNDVMPILAKEGCNSTACHGSPAGKNGFKLSLFGYDPAADHAAIVEGSGGRRVNLKDPIHSLILLKPSFSIPHGGGQRFKVGSPEYHTLLAWLQAGAPGVSETAPHVQSVAVTPQQPWLPRPGSKQHLIVTATMSDGSSRDVTDKALFSANDDAIAKVDSDGLVSAARPGETAIMVRYMGQVAVSRVAVLPPWKLPHYPKLAQYNYIDRLVQAKLEKLRVVPSGLCTDEEFIRRATLDTCGIIPTVEEVQRFVADPSPDKRAKLIDQLLDRPEFIDLWTLKWNDALRNNPRLTREGALPYSNWIRDQVRQNRPFDQWVRDLLTATGKNADVKIDPANLPPQVQQQLAKRPRAEQLIQQINNAPFNPAANYYLVTRDPLDLTSATCQTFLGVRIECARCHNHPYEKWTQSDYYHLAAFFTGINAQGANQTPRLVSVNERATLRMPDSKQVVEPRTLDGTVGAPLVGVPGAAPLVGAPGADKRQALAEWLTSRSNPFFAEATVNRVWAQYFGRGIVNPIDDFRVTNPPSNSELLKALADDFVIHNFDLKYIHRLILNSRTYQQSSLPNQYNRQDTANFARYYPKRMMAEQLYDSISQATGVFPPLNRPARPGLLKNGKKPVLNYYQQMLADQPLLTRATQLAVMAPGQRGPRGDLGVFLDTFGKPRREVVCACERSDDGNIGQALALINGDEVNAKIAAPQGRVQQLVQSNKPDSDVINELYLATLSRRPTVKEGSEARALIDAGKSRAEGISDLMWSLLNSREFLFVH